jgi:hypothetical protein
MRYGELLQLLERIGSGGGGSGRGSSGGGRSDGDKIVIIKRSRDSRVVDRPVGGIIPGALARVGQHFNKFANKWNVPSVMGDLKKADRENQIEILRRQRERDER